MKRTLRGEVSRRHLVVGGGVLVGLAGSQSLAANAFAGQPSLAADYRAVFSQGGKTFVFEGAKGEDMGDYVGEFVHQHCVRVLLPENPFTVFFRPDASGDRFELVVELGRMWGAEPPAHILEPYQVEIFRGNTSIAKVEVPFHWWWARWRWQSSPRPIVRRPDSLISRGLLPPYGPNEQLSIAPLNRAFSYQKPMDLAGVDSSWGDTGERNEIGPVTEPQAIYVLEGSSSALQTLLAQAEAAASAPMHWRDERTGTFLNFQQHAGASWNPSDGKPVIPNPPMPRENGKPNPDYTHLDTSHAPATAYLPFMLTDDPFFLEELQCFGDLTVGFAAIFRDKYNLPCLASPHQTRGFAWSMRSLFQLGMVSPEKPPSWLLPRSYWRKCIADSRAFMQLYMESPARIHRYFRVFPSSDPCAAWQSSMLGFILGWGVLMGYAEWRDAYEWFLPNQISQCDGKSGWNREWPTPYFWYPLKTWRTREPSHLFQDAAIDSETCLSWQDAWNFFKSEQKIDDSGWDGHTIMQGLHGPSYYLYLQGSLRLARHLGIAEAIPSSKWLDEELPRAPGLSGAHGYAKWSIRST